MRASLLCAVLALLCAAPATSLDFVRSDAPTGGLFSTGVALGDVDGDGDPDVISSNYSSGDLTVFRNDGGASLTPIAQFAAGGPFGPWWVDAGDLDGDGFAEILAAQLGEDRVLVFRNDGSGNFFAPESYPVVGEPEFVHIADIDEDGFMDFAATNEDPFLSIFFGDGTGFFNPGGADITLPLPHEGGHTVRTDDFDQDGNVDLVVSFSSAFTPDCLSGRPPVAVAFGDGTGQFPVVQEAGEFMGYHGINGDFNNDGFPDIATADSCSGEVRVILNDGTGAFPDPPAIFLVGQSHNDLNTADMNCDGNLDLLVADASNQDPRLHILLGDGTGDFAPDVDSPFASNGAPSGVKVADMDLDPNGFLDMATANIGTDTASMWINIQPDDDPPVVTCQTEVACLWPPNHKFVDVGLSISGQDACTGFIEGGEILSVVSDEPTNTQLGAGGKGNDQDPTPHAPDAFLDADGRLHLRAERAGLSDGRVYRIRVRVTDRFGNPGEGVCEVRVPHDQDPKTPGQVPGNLDDGSCPAVDSGEEFDAFAVN